MPILREENCVGGAGSIYGRRQKRYVGYSKLVGRVQRRPALSAISEDGVLHAPVSACQPNRDFRRMKKSLTMDKEKAMDKSWSPNTRNLYRYAINNSSIVVIALILFGLRIRAAEMSFRLLVIAVGDLY